MLRGQSEAANLFNELASRSASFGRRRVQRFAREVWDNDWLFNTAGVKGRSRIGALTAGEAIGRGAVQAPAAVRNVAVTASAQVVRIAERAKRLTG